MTLQCDHPSRGPHIASCIQHSPCPFSPDLTSCDFLLWGYLKSNVLKDNILWTVLSIPGDMSLLAVENVMYRIQCEVHEKGVHIERDLVLWYAVISSL
ncbi:hypothetical protein AVEN_268560-1 [Araneus ventricosus]|uniref:Uncharacterized protein n=1 Tax=Araneus ventricosus TaxID=182803 RepID=A0A4Y2V9L0_ARAVE|nr:hypothetical protein AVEN_268560-1 [Araneus ventricosus]